MKTLFSFTLLLLAFIAAIPFTQSQQILTITSSSTATTSNYDDVMAQVDAKGFTNLGWTFHAVGAAQPTGLFSIGLFPDRAALDARMEKVRPVFQESGVNVPAPQVYEVYRTFTGDIPAAKPDAGILVFFDGKGMTSAQYDQIIAGLVAAKVPNPPTGQIFHAAIQTPEGLKVIDVWESAEHFQAFGNALMPAIQAAGVTPPPPTIYSLHRYITPEK